MSSAELGGAIAGGGIFAIALLGTALGVGRIGDFQALSIIEAVLPTARFLASASITAGAAVLALLLTLLGLSLTAEITFDPRLYKRARYITALSTALIVIAVAVLLLTTVPLREVEGLSGFYDIFYYFLAASTSLLGGVVVTVGLMISATLLGLIELAHPEGSNLLRADSHQDGSEGG